MEQIPQISLEAARVNAKMTQQEAANALGISKSTLQNYESGKTVPDWDMVHKIGRVYKFPHEYIFFGSRYG